MEENNSYARAVYWIEVDKVDPNPYQPRREFNEANLQSLADSIKQYGVLQPIVVTRKEETKEDGGIAVTYELIAGERRLRASKMAGVNQIPAVIRAAEESDKVKLELAIIENLQREDLSPVDRAHAFDQLAREFNLTHTEIAKKIGMSREYVSNTIRLLLLPEQMLEALSNKKISEGHTRPILMLSDRPKEQNVLFMEIITKGMTVREAEAISRRIAKDKVRRPHLIFDKSTMEIEERLAQVLGTRVRIEKKEKGGRITIEFFSPEDLDSILNVIAQDVEKKEDTSSQNHASVENDNGVEETNDDNEEDLYSIKNFSI